MSETIYLAVRYDRHSDDLYAASWKLERAKAQCDEWASEYGDRYNFAPPSDWDWEKHSSYYLDSDDEEGPHMRVQEVELV